MRVGVIVDGQAEAAALGKLLHRLEIANNQIIAVAYADLQPRATVQQVARKAIGRLEVLASKRVDVIVVLLDREDRQECCSKLAEELATEFIRHGKNNVSVVIKNRQFENWLIADPHSIRTNMPARFEIDHAFVNRVTPNRADNISNPVRLLDRAAKGPNYHKRRDAVAIARVVIPANVAQNSRSFRRLLRVLGSAAYSSQSRLPQ